MRRLYLPLLSCLMLLPELYAQRVVAGFPGYEPGFFAEYFSDTVFRQRVHTRIDERIHLDYYTRQPAPGIYNDKYSIRWTGKIRPERTGLYTIYVIVDDGVRLWLDNRLVLNEWRLQRATPFASKIFLQGGIAYDLRLEYFNGKTACYLRFFWAYEDEHPVPIDSRVAIANRASANPLVLGQRPNQRQPVLAQKKATEPLSSIAPAQAAPQPGTGRTPPASTPSVQESVQEPLAENTTPVPVVFENLKAGQPVVLSQLQFARGTYQLYGDYGPVLKKLLNTMLAKEHITILIAGHTDNVGDPARNLQLSRQRAIVIRNYLVRQGIAENRISTEGYGGTQPLADNSTEEGRQQNRRVEFKVLSGL